jgi:hypothetical protein
MPEVSCVCVFSVSWDFALSQSLIGGILPDVYKRVSENWITGSPKPHRPVATYIYSRHDNFHYAPC